MRTAVRVRRLGWRGFTPGFRTWALAVALLPTLTFLGHWSLHFDVPGTNLYVVLVPGEPSDAHSHDGETPGSGEPHERHCHAGVASCSDIPFTGASPFAMLSDSLAYLGTLGALTAVALIVWQPAGGATVPPDRRPPKVLLVSA